TLARGMGVAEKQRKAFLGGKKVADRIKVSPTYEEDEELKQPQRDEDERKSGKLRGLRERRAGFFREHPKAKWIVLFVALVLLAGALFVWHYYSVRESTDDAQIDGHIYPISS